ncbi:transposase family protein [Microcoleus sp. MON1_C5]|uniref:transposase family protein n=1 Tax=Microcoleus sp. MON1_C5 TaxID=2818828 RepID=UPI002FCFEA04
MSQLREHIERHPSETTGLLDLKYDQLIGLITHAENLYNQQKKVQDNYKIRIIKGGGSRPPKLEIAAQILLSLVYLHHVPTFKILGVQFGVSESAANYIFHKWIKVFRELLPA